MKQLVNQYFTTVTLQSYTITYIPDVFQDDNTFLVLGLLWPLSDVNFGLQGLAAASS
jgi:hypothetical protein